MSGRTPDEGRYSKVSRRMWDDERFRELTPAPPNAQTLWQRLMTGPELGCIPGLFTARLGGLADALGWSTEDTRDKWTEIESKGMAEADWRAGVVWVPNAIVHNEPTSLNTVIGWRLALKELPECALKQKAISALRDHIEMMGETWAKAFDEAIDKPKRKPSPMPKAMPSPKARALASDTQEQDTGTGYKTQEQESSEPRDAPPPPPSVGPRPISSAQRQALALATAAPEDVAVLEAWRDRFKKTDVTFTADRAVPIAERRAHGMTQQDALDALVGAERDAWFIGKGSPVSLVFNQQERFEQYRDAGRAVREGRPLPRAAKPGARGVPPPRQPDSGNYSPLSKVERI